MDESLAITCPTCGEEFRIAVAPEEGAAVFVVDCEVCCRPMTVTVRVQDGELHLDQVSAE